MSSVLFHSNQLSNRGTEISMWDYASCNETILNNSSYIAFPYGSDKSSFDKFYDRFPGKIIEYASLDELEAYASLNNIDTTYWIKYGTDDGKQLKNTRNVVHGVFTGEQPHGNRFAVVSKWLGKKYNVPYVPHIISLPEVDCTYREFLNIPADAIVCVRVGGNDSFNIPYVQNTVYRVALKRPDMYFLFLNTDYFCPSLPNIIHIGPTTDRETIATFLKTGDAFLYGRDRGESFGLSIGEALYSNLPVICPIKAPERNHIEMLGREGIYHSSAAELETILLNLKKRGDKDYRHLVEEYSEKRIMEKFNEVFLK